MGVTVASHAPEEKPVAGRVAGVGLLSRFSHQPSLAWAVPKQRPVPGRVAGAGFLSRLWQQPSLAQAVRREFRLAICWGRGVYGVKECLVVASNHKKEAARDRLRKPGIRRMADLADSTDKIFTKKRAQDRVSQTACGASRQDYALADPLQSIPHERWQEDEVDAFGCSVRFNGARWHALNLASCFTPLTLHLTLVSMRQELLEAFEILLACQHLILLAVAASDRLELTQLANLSNEQPSIDESAGEGSQPTDSTASGASSASTSSPAPTNEDTAYATSLERFLVTLSDYEAVDRPADTASPTKTQPELPSHGPGR
ncbi:hypothetical protein PCASD_01180 [Puccinia coronata f. sp. avenae]|uniref:Uncharacterized protein n=1 Tax=Puccinia coronata f. sp. avenae TaxID=200324 RepID=A0A2N5VLS9_9BASI|nr:hypothetical protein PCASD_01180 [Puccinia coronata f. sp. avenae]